MKRVCLVIDANVVVDLAREIGGQSTGQRTWLEAMCSSLNNPVRIDGEAVVMYPVMSEHIVRMAGQSLHRYFPEAEAKRTHKLAVQAILKKGGLYDPTQEDYKTLARQCWAHYGTDTEDEAVVACAVRNRAAVLTNDRDLGGYLDDRHIANWSTSELASAVTCAVANSM